jgi:hypothetical protein
MSFYINRYMLADGLNMQGIFFQSCFWKIVNKQVMLGYVILSYVNFIDCGLVLMVDSLCFFTWRNTFTCFQFWILYKGNKLLETHFEHAKY